MNSVKCKPSKYLQIRSIIAYLNFVIWIQKKTQNVKQSLLYFISKFFTHSMHNLNILEMVFSQISENVFSFYY